MKILNWLGITKSRDDTNDWGANIAPKRGIERIQVFGKIPDIDYVGYRDDEDKGCHWIELNAFNILALKKAGVPFRKELRSVYTRLFANKTEDLLMVRTNKPLLPFQLEGVTFLHIKKGRAILCDEMGLGKTIQVIGLLSAKPDKYMPTIVICPAHVKLNWRDEVKDFLISKGVEVLFGQTPYALPKSTKIVILNHHILGAWMPTLQRLGAKYLVVDEAHGLVNQSTKSYALVQELAQSIGRVTLLTGTPLVNKTEDLFALVNLISPYILGTCKTRFMHRFCPEKSYEHSSAKRFGNRKNRWGNFRKQAREVPEEPPQASDRDLRLLNQILVYTCMLRRLKKDVAKELPKKCRKVFRIRVDEKQFWKAEKELRARIATDLAKKGLDGIVDMHSYSRMRRLVGEAKYDDMCEWIENWLSDNPDSKLVVTGWHKDVLGKLHEKFPASFLITGDVSTEKKYKIGKEFEKPDTHRILFGNIKAIGTGIKLVVADTMMFVELPYTGADLSQVEDRIHRLSQMAKRVYYTYFVVEGSLEEDLLRYISRKQELSGKVVDNREVETLEDIVEDVPNEKVLRKLLLN